MASTLIALLLLEVGVRLLVRSPPWQAKQILTRTRTRNRNSPRNEGADCYPSNPRGYFTRVAAEGWNGAYLIQTHNHEPAQVVGDTLALTLTPYCVEFRTNQHGHRGPDHHAARTARTLRILAVGDSFVYGEGVRDDDTMPMQLQRILAERHPELTVEVVNLGHAGADTAKEIQVLVADANLVPDVVLLGYVLNDAYYAHEGRAPAADDFILMRPQPVIGSGADPWLQEHSRLYGLVVERVRAWQVHRRTLAWYRDALDPVVNPKGMAQTERRLGEFAQQARALTGQTLVAIYPLLYKLDDYPFAAGHATLGTLLDRLGLPWVDLRDALRGHPTESLIVHAIDRHPNNVAQRLIAETLAAELERRGWVVPRAVP